jgi:hypothetical protein
MGRISTGHVKCELCRGSPGSSVWVIDRKALVGGFRMQRASVPINPTSATANNAGICCVGGSGVSCLHAPPPIGCDLPPCLPPCLTTTTTTSPRLKTTTTIRLQVLQVFAPPVARTCKPLNPEQGSLLLLPANITADRVATIPNNLRRHITREATLSQAPTRATPNKAVMLPSLDHR